MTRIKIRTKVYRKLSYIKSKTVDFSLSILAILLKRVAGKIGRIKLLNVRFLDENLPVKMLVGEEESIIYSPLSCSEEAKNSIKVIAPPVSLYALSSVNVHARSSAFLSEKDVVIERIPSIDMAVCNYATGALLYHDREVALVKLGCCAYKLNDAIFMGGNGSMNYYHWMVEILPKAKFVIESGILKKTKNVIVSKDVLDTPSFYEALDLAFSGLDVNYFFIGKDQYASVEMLYYISSPSNILFNSRGRLSDPLHCFYRKGTLDYLRTLVLGNKNDSAKEKSDQITLRKSASNRIFLARKAGLSKREYNQDDVQRYLVDALGFSVVFVENYSLSEQALLFNGADIIVGASGAAWTNLIFCRPNTLAISWLPNIIFEFSAYSTIAEYYQVKMRFVKCNADYNVLHTSYRVSIESLSQLMNEVGIEGSQQC